MLLGRFDRDPPTLAALGRRWAMVTRMPDGLSPRQAGVVSAAAVQRIDPIARTGPASLAIARPNADTDQAITLPPHFKAVAAFRASLLMAERAVSRIDLRFAPAPEERATASRAAETKERPARAERASSSGADVAALPLVDAEVGRSYNVRL